MTSFDEKQTKEQTENRRRRHRMMSATRWTMPFSPVETAARTGRGLFDVHCQAPNGEKWKCQVPAVNNADALRIFLRRAAPQEYVVDGWLVWADKVNL